MLHVTHPSTVSHGRIYLTTGARSLVSLHSLVWVITGLIILLEPGRACECHRTSSSIPSPTSILHSEYDFHTFNSIGGNGTVNVTTYVSPSLNANGADRPIGFAVQIDSDSPQTSYYMPPAAPGQQPAAWGGNDGFAANVIVPVMQSFNATPGSHTLKVHSLLESFSCMLIM